MKTYIVEVEKGIDWNNGFLNYAGKVIEDIRQAEQFEDYQNAEDAATLFNAEYGKSGKIYARVR